MQPLRVIDSHTGGEPTRVVVDGLPDLGTGPMADRLAVMRNHHDHCRTALVTEPRGSDVMVGAALLKPVDPDCVAGVIFFNNVGYLGMCGHGLIGLVATLAHLKQIAPGRHRVETPVGEVSAVLHPDGRVSVRNVPAYRFRKAVAIEVPGRGSVTGDIAYGGNWFFLTADHGRDLVISDVEELTACARDIRRALDAQHIAGAGGAPIDHVELIGPGGEGADATNFVLCPGGAYDRSPCGTGTSAKLACLAAEDLLKEGETWRQRSVVGSVFEATYERDGDAIIPTITGRAFVNGDCLILFDPADPFRHGIAPHRGTGVPPASAPSRVE